MTKVSIIIVNFNTAELTRQAVASVISHTRGVTFDIIVVDNGSSEPGLEAILSHFPSVKLIRSEENLGFARGNNLAFAHAEGEYLGLLNSDAFLQNDAFTILADFLDQHPGCAIAGPTLRAVDQSVQNSILYRPGLVQTIADLLLPGHRMRRWDEKHIVTIAGAPHPFAVSTGLSGACILVRRSALTDDRILDPNFFFYLEDVDLAFDATAHGWSLYHVPAAAVVHLVSSSKSQESQGQRLRRQELYWRALLYFFKKHKSVAEFHAMRAVLGLLFAALYLVRRMLSRGAASERMQKAVYSLRVMRMALGMNAAPTDTSKS